MAMWRICRHSAGKKMRQDGAAEFISASLNFYTKNCALIILQERIDYYDLFDKDANFYYDFSNHTKEEQLL